MKLSLLFIILFIPAICTSQLKENICDEKILTTQELENCKSDSIWSNEIQIRVNYITALKTQILPRFRSEREKLLISDELISDAKALKKVYDSLTKRKLFHFAKEMDKNTLFVQPKSYIATLLSLQLFNFYPDTYAIMINPIHLSLRPRSTENEVKTLEQQIDNLYNKIPSTLRSELSATVIEIKKEKLKHTNANSIYLLQGHIDESARKKYDIINYLIWIE